MTAPSVEFPPGAAENARRILDLADIARRVRLNLIDFDLSKNERRFLDLLLLVTFDAGIESLRVPNPQKQLADFLLLDDSKLKDVATKLHKHGFARRHRDGEAMVYRIDPSTANWTRTRIRPHAESVSRWEALNCNPSQAGLPFDPEPLSVIIARNGLEDVREQLARVRIVPSAENPETTSAQAKGRFVPSEPSAKVDAPAQKGRIVPSALIDQIDRSKIESISSCAENADRLLADLGVWLGEAETANAKQWRWWTLTFTQDPLALAEEFRKAEAEELRRRGTKDAIRNRGRYLTRLIRTRFGCRPQRPVRPARVATASPPATVVADPAKVEEARNDWLQLRAELGGRAGP